MKKYRLNKEKFSEFLYSLLGFAMIEGIWLMFLLELAKPM